MTRRTQIQIRAEAKKNADEVVVFANPEDASILPGLAGRIAPSMLRNHGYYTATIDGRKMFYELSW